MNMALVCAITLLVDFFLMAVPLRGLGIYRAFASHGRKIYNTLSIPYHYFLVLEFGDRRI